VRGSCSLNLNLSLSTPNCQTCKPTIPSGKLCAKFRLRLAACSKHLASRTQTALREKVFAPIRSLPARISWSLLTTFYRPEWIVWVVAHPSRRRISWHRTYLSVSIPGGAYDGSRKRPQSFEYEVYEIRYQACDSFGAMPSTKTKQGQENHYYHFPRRLSGSDPRRTTLKNIFVGSLDLTNVVLAE
jgi:hypothetical protein